MCCEFWTALGGGSSFGMGDGSEVMGIRGMSRWNLRTASNSTVPKRQTGVGENE